MAVSGDTNVRNLSTERLLYLRDRQGKCSCIKDVIRELRRREGRSKQLKRNGGKGSSHKEREVTGR